MLPNPKSRSRLFVLKEQSPLLSDIMGGKSLGWEPLFIAVLSTFI